MTPDFTLDLIASTDSARDASNILAEVIDAQRREINLLSSRVDLLLRAIAHIIAKNEPSLADDPDFTKLRNYFYFKDIT